MSVFRAAAAAAFNPEPASMTVLLRLLKSAPEAEAEKALRYLVGDLEPVTGYALLSPPGDDRYIGNIVSDEKDVWDNYVDDVGIMIRQEDGRDPTYWELVADALKNGYTVVKVRSVYSQFDQE